MPKFLFNIVFYIMLYFIIINLVGLIAMRTDKSRAIKDKRRIPENTLFIISIIGGSVGTLIGMYLFRHKTKHVSFVVGIPAILILQIVIVLVSNHFFHFIVLN